MCGFKKKFTDFQEFKFFTKLKTFKPHFLKFVSFINLNIGYKQTDTQKRQESEANNERMGRKEIVISDSSKSGQEMIKNRILIFINTIPVSSSDGNCSLSACSYRFMLTLS